jgi:glucose-6-phosphate dehydrogenase assembly protein OpcA
MEDAVTSPALNTITDETVRASVGEVEQELALRLQACQDPGEEPIQRAYMSNLVIYCDQPSQVELIAAQIPAIVAIHPARVLFLVADPSPGPSDLDVQIRVRTHRSNVGRRLSSELVTLRAWGSRAERLAFAMRGLLIGDLPTNLWWASLQPPPLAGALLLDLTEPTQQIVYDSIGWTEPALGVAATDSWLTQLDQNIRGSRRIAADLNWRRLKYWRRLLAQALDPASAPGALQSITEVRIEHGPHAVIQAWELMSWLASRLHWQVQQSRVQPGAEICWQLTTPHRPLRVCIHRLPEGPSEIRRVRISCSLGGKPVALSIRVEDERRLAVFLEGMEAAPRTVTVQPQALADMLGRQLCDREPDPVFRESMSVAQLFAQSVLG